MPRDETHSSIDPQTGQLLNAAAYRAYLDGLANGQPDPLAEQLQSAPSAHETSEPRNPPRGEDVPDTSAARDAEVSGDQVRSLHL